MSFLFLSITLSFLARVMAQTIITVNASASHAIPTTLSRTYKGCSMPARVLMAYRVDAQSGDGGLYGELLQNRALQLVQPGSSDALQGWNVLGDADLSVIEDDNPVSSALPNSLKLVIPDETANTIGFSNSGYWGMKVEASALYNASFYYRFPQASNFSGGLSLALQSSSGDVLASAIVNVSGEQTDWLQASAALVPLDSAVDVNNVFTVSLDGSAAAGQTIHFAMFSLSPPTFKNRHNGMRTDIAQGYTVALRWKWNETIGDLVERPGRQGTWNYVNTDGLGLYEYLLWCEDTGMEPILGVFAGYSLDQRTVPEDQLGAYVQEAIDMIHFAISDPAKNDAGKFSTALRASLGHPLPFSLKYVEVGNEDGISDNALDTWRAYSTALQAEFPSLTLIATTRPNLAKLEPAPAVHDIHDYEGPDWFRENVFYLCALCVLYNFDVNADRTIASDDVERDGTLYIESEYSCQYDRQGQVNLYPTVLSAVHEAAFMTGLERNSDIVLAASYAPLLNHVNATQWAPNLIAFDYYVQQLFGQNRGEEYLPSTLPERNGTLYWSVARNDSAVIIKVANLATDPASLTFQLPFDSVAESGVLTYITGSETDENTPEQPDLITPQTTSVETGSTFNYTAPGSSFGVLVVGV
ncbi:alpha-L-arabinofuranosidase C-terminus-domain-containing protein [Schizophyllum commune]